MREIHGFHFNQAFYLPTHVYSGPIEITKELLYNPHCRLNNFPILQEVNRL